MLVALCNTPVGRERRERGRNTAGTSLAPPGTIMRFLLLHLLPCTGLAIVACGSTPSSPPATATATATATSNVPVAVAAPSAVPTATPELLAEIHRGIAQHGPSSFEIARATLGQIIDDQPALMSEARIVPETDHGKIVGARVFGVTPDSTLGTLGIQNGDRVERVDGTDMSSPSQLVATVVKLRTADHFTVVLERAGHEMSIDYDVK
jgi:general secretion pathway protein C